MDEKIKHCRSTVEALTGAIEGNTRISQNQLDFEGNFRMNQVVDLSRSDWLNVRGLNRSAEDEAYNQAMSDEAFLKQLDLDEEEVQPR